MQYESLTPGVDDTWHRCENMTPGVDVKHFCKRKAMPRANSCLRGACGGEGEGERAMDNFEAWYLAFA